MEGEDDYDGFPGVGEGWLAVDGVNQADSEVGSEPFGLDSQDSEGGSGQAPPLLDEEEEEVLDFSHRADAEVKEAEAYLAEEDELIAREIDRNFRIAQMSLLARSVIMPWETGIAAGVFVPGVLGSLQATLQRPEFRFPVNDVQPSVDPAVLARKKAMAQTSFPVSSRRIQDMRVTDSTDLLRSRALARWKQIIQLSPESSDTGRLLLREVQHLKDDATLVRILGDTVAKKAASTLLKRSGEILKFMSFCMKLKREPFPFDEQLCYQYLCAMSESKTASPTNANSFRSAVAFCLHTFGFDGCQQVLESKRSQGIAHRMKSSKAPLKQKRPFTVAEIVALERFASDPLSTVVDALFVGHILFCIYSRSRWGDHEGIERLTWDFDGAGGGFVQGDTRKAKTSVTAEQKTRFLPLTAPLCRLGPHEWWNAWKHNRVLAGLETSAHEPFLPAPANDGTWCLRPVSAGEASAWIREILRILGFSGVDVGSHSCKATLLSWCSKAGVSQPNRLLLGYHVNGTSKTMLHYSRDALSGPLRSLNRVLAAVVAKRFFPDLTRSGYFAQPAVKRVKLHEAASSSEAVVARVGNDESVEKPEQPFESSSSSSSESSSEESSCDETLIAAEGLQKGGNAPAAGGEGLFVHVRLGTLHKVKRDDSQRLACGRHVNLAYKPVAEVLLHYVECTVCFGSRS